MKIILVSGTPGTGKTTVAKKLSKKLNYYCVDVNILIYKYKLSEGYDKKRKTKIVDIQKLNEVLINIIENNKNIKKYKGIIIDSHLSHYLPKKYADFCIVTKCGIGELNRRLKRRKYPKDKIHENLQAEIFDVCHNEALKRKHKLIVIDTTKDFNIARLAQKLGG